MNALTTQLFANSLGQVHDCEFFGFCLRRDGGTHFPNLYAITVQISLAGTTQFRTKIVGHQEWADTFEEACADTLAYLGINGNVL